MNLNPSILYLDVLLKKNEDKLEFKVKHKPTCENNHVHFYSHRNNTKRAIMFLTYGPPYLLPEISR